MSNPNQTIVPDGAAVQILFCIRANKGLYGYAYGPFRFDEARKLYVYKGQTFSVDEWEREGPELIQRFYKYRCSVKVEIVPVAIAPAASPEPAKAEVVENPAPHAEDAAPSPEVESTEAEPPVKRTRKPAASKTLSASE